MALLKTFFDQAEIANARLLEAVERQRTELARFLSPQVAELITSSDGRQLLAGHRAYLTIAYFDLRGFTAFAETAEPQELIDIVREYHAVAGELVVAHSGTPEHFAGDGIMVFFNDPVPVAEPELEAATLALAMRERVGERTERWRKRGYDLGLGAGIAVGYATLGRIGFEGRYEERDEHRRAAERRGSARADPPQPAGVRGAGRASRRRACRRVAAEGARAADGGLRAPWHLGGERMSQ